MTVLRDAIPVEFPALFRVSGELCLLPVFAAKTSSETPQSVLSIRPKTSRAPSRLNVSAPRRSLPHAQKPIPSPVRLTRSVQ
jgi:hypothetical protein